MAVAPPTLVAEIDFQGNPSATYYDRHLNGSGIVSYWRLDNTATFLDVLAANNGVVRNAPTLVSGALNPLDTNQALSFNGTNEDAYVLSSATLTPSALSLETWVKVASYPGSTKELAGKRGSYYLQMTSAGVVTFKVKNDTNLTTVQTTGPISTGDWHHIVATWDGATAAIYQDGILDSLAAHAVGIEATLNPLRLAARPGTSVPVALSGAPGNLGTGTSVSSLAVPGAAAGELLLAHFNVQGSVSITAEPTGWTLLKAADHDGQTTRLYWKLATGSEPASYAWTISASANWLIEISRIGTVDQIAPVPNPGYGGSTGAAATSHPTGTHLPNLDNCMVAVFFSASSLQTWTADSGTELYDFGSAGFGSLAAYTQTQTTATSIQVTGTTGGSTAGSAFMVILGGSGTDYAAVSLDDTSVWNRGLDANEVRALYESRLSGVGAWTNITADVRNLQTRAGRQYELNRIEAGTASGGLNDLSRDYDPADATSIYSPNVIPLRKIRAKATISAVTYPIFSDFVERWPSKWPGKEFATVDLTMVDGFEPLAFAGVTGTIASNLSGTQINDVLDKALWPSADRAIDDGVFTMAEQVLAADTKALSEIQDIADSELGLFFIDRDGVATFHDSAHRWISSRSITSQATFKDAVTLTDPATQVAYTDLVPSFDKDALINEWKVATAGGSIQTARDEVSASLYFRRTQARSTRLDAAADALTQATALLQSTAKPALRFDSLMVKPSTTFEWQTTLNLRISDRVTVVRSPVPSAGGTVITKECFVEGIAWNIAPGPTWPVTFQLSPVSTASYFDTIVRDAPISYWRMAAVA